MAPLIHKQILVTLAYVAHFGFPLTPHEVWERLVAIGGDKGFSLAQVKAGLEELEKAGYVEQNQGYYQIVPREDQLVAGLARQVFLTPQERVQRAKWSIQKVQAAAAFIWWCRHLPWVKAVAVTGSVAVANAVADDDVDFLVICQRNRLWLVRPLLVGVANWYGKRRTWAGEEKNSWCLNFWLDEAAIKLGRNRYSLYTAYELCQAQWVVNTNQLAERLLLANVWAGRVVPNLFMRSYKELVTTSSLYQPPKRFSQPLWLLGWKIADRVLGSFWTLGNSLAYLVQRRYMKAHQTREEVSQQAAFFHPRDTKKTIMKSVVSVLQHPAQTGFEQAVQVSWKARQKHQKVVLVTGVFDLLHAAHQEFLRKAKLAGEVLIVGVESDVRVRQLKGAGRPVQTQAQRVAAIEQLAVADAVFVLPEQFAQKEDHERLIFQLRPAVLAVSEHTPYLEGKKEILAKVGGTVVIVMELDPTISTTQLLQSN